jgi:hypothetical protein
VGCDLYMEEMYFQPRRPKARWLRSGNILVETDRFYVGYKEFYRGPLTKEVERMLKQMGVRLPPKERVSNDCIKTD